MYIYSTLVMFCLAGAKIITNTSSELLSLHDEHEHEHHEQLC